MGTMLSTEQVIADMLTENTGIHMLDSGMANNRAWQRNQAAAGGSPLDYFKARPSGELSTWINSNGTASLEMLTLDVFHWLTERVEYLPDEDAAFQAWADLDENKESGWLQLMEEWPERWARLVTKQQAEEEGDVRGDYVDDYFHPPGGIYGEGDPLTINTYNGEDALSQTLQYTYWQHPSTGDYEGRILLQIHGGADVRGGYTRPRLFSCSVEEYSILDNSRAEVSCSNPECTHGTYGERSCWYTDDAGYNFYNYDPELPNLSDCKVMVRDSVNLAFREVERRVHAFATESFTCYVPEPIEPIIWVDQTEQYHGTAHCPVCETGTLEVFAY